MTQAEGRMPKEIENPNDAGSREGTSASDLALRGSFADRHSEFGFLGRYFREWSVACTFGLLLLVLALFAPGFFQKSQLLSIVSSAVPVLLVACGMTLVIICRQIDISVGSQFALCSIFLGL